MPDYETEIKELISQLNYYTKLYDEGVPIITDEEWDNLYFKLQNLEALSGIYLADSPTQKINYEVVNNLTKVKHNHPMLSLDKTKDWNTFINYFGCQPAVIMPKLDGLTCSLRYNKGYLVSAETRGDGITGEDILHNAKVIKDIPNKISYDGELIIDGEVICTYANFEPFKEEFANPRNFASGSIRLLDSAECARRHLSFIAWNVVNNPCNSTWSTNIEYVQTLGFITCPFIYLSENPTANDIAKLANIYLYPIDGIVGRFNDTEYAESLGATEHHTKAAYAFKFYDEQYETKLLNIEWSMGRTGQLTPIAIFEPVDTGDSIITRANLHNITIMKETLHGTGFEGQKIKVCKMNDIIPQVVWAEGK